MRVCYNLGMKMPTLHFLCLFSCLVLLTGCIVVAAPTTAEPTPISTQIQSPFIENTPQSSISMDSQPALSVSFTDPASSRAEPEQLLVEAIGVAKTSVDIAVYSLSLPDVRDALLSAVRRGVTVRLVMESDNLDSEQVQSLLDAKIPILGDRREGLMHNKFMVVDGKEVWTGSMNYTVNGARSDRNDLVHIVSAEVAQDYTTEFEEMFVQDQFGSGSPANTPYPTTALSDGTKIEVLFSPDDQVADRLIGLIRSAKESITVLAYTWTSNPMADALVEQADRGVNVRMVMDADLAANNTGSDLKRFQQAGMDVKVWRAGGLMHFKSIIIDGKIVATGSYNFTASAERNNDENMIIIHQPELAAKYLAEFERIDQIAER